MRANEGLSGVETIKKIYILDREFSVDEDELTPTLKLKRRIVQQRYGDAIESLYV